MIRKEKVANKRFEAYGLLGSKFKSLALLLVLFINFWSQWSESKRKFPLECSLKFDEVVAGKLEILLYPKQQFISIERVRGGVKKVVLWGGGGWGGSEVRPQLSAKKVTLFIFASIRCRSLQNV